jgi:hypothetical protein
MEHGADPNRENKVIFFIQIIEKKNSPWFGKIKKSNGNNKSLRG